MSDALLALQRGRPSADFDAKVAHSIAVLQEAARQYSPLTQASSLGAEDMVVTDLIQRSGIDSAVFVLDTGKLHEETVALIGRLQAHYGREVEVYRPDAATAEAFVAANGEDAMYKSIALRKQCCDIRKMVPLEAALAGKRAWITGLRREQSQARAEVHDIEAPASDKPDARAKANPLAAWTWGDVWHYITTNGVPYNPLHDQFFPSIGCAPCTRAVTLGEDFRSGRWWWENESAKECGLHVAEGHDGAPSGTSQDDPTSADVSPDVSPLNFFPTRSSSPQKETAA
ncbi:phosphoadenylyl-sulfate reductase [Xylophilus rhododendri]|jgi:phosphoadenosine phosphosulfate reductase|uniref:Adenosine 5'-phosphosulfate reductase n=1 Tax=Xylophilus rhododendri TaxID=2697032 RepID=A0A857IYG1_9BURK|nr:phosphoadenylyl-sulfate reductase [Xylophilus rhododendri]QHI96584.1 phosphoadenylyl-sulfate reductase [Xylophilus rhododendri]